MRKIILSVFLLLPSCWLFAQPTSNYFVFLADKDLGQSPMADFTPQALQRRAKMGIPFPMSEDFPVNPAYLSAIAGRVQATRHALRWCNAVTVTATPAQIMELETLPYVLSIAPFERIEMQLAEESEKPLSAKDSLQYHQLFDHQRSLVHLQALEAAGLSGKGVRIAIFDAGFSGADTHIAFAHLRANGQIKATRDFVSKDDDVYGNSNHGTAVLSCIAGLYEGKRIGVAVDAEFLLARTERNLREPISEEDNWMAAMEWADQQGADIISSSLGYTKPRYSYADMTGQKTRVTRAAAMAVRKGILVVNSAGNEGRDKFHYVSAPADADSVLTVGASYPMFPFRMPFSSFGPNARGVTKPEISGPGYVLAANQGGGYRPIGGTSFACPIVAGMAACIVQKWPSETNLQIRDRIIQAGNTYPYFDYELGYGVLDAQKALLPPTDPPKATFTVDRIHDTLWINIDRRAMVQDSANFKNGKPFSVHKITPDGKLSMYKTYLLQQRNLRFGIPPSPDKAGQIEMWFQGYLWKEN